MAAERQQNNASGAIKGKAGKSQLDFTKNSSESCNVAVVHPSWLSKIHCSSHEGGALRSEQPSG